MGYSQNLSYNKMQKDITYRDIAGTLITLGYHTDSDHSWISDETLSSTGRYQLICVICNGEKYVSSLQNINYEKYKKCSNNHNVESGNMMMVASNQTNDYYKCKYCRYVSGVSNLSAQNYIYSNYNETYHKITNNVDGLVYDFYVPHKLLYRSINSQKHKITCTCNYYEETSHVISESDYYDGNNTASCYYCRAILDISGSFYPLIPTSNVDYSNENIAVLSTGIIVVPDAQLCESVSDE